MFAILYLVATSVVVCAQQTKTPGVEARLPIWFDQRDPADREMCIETDFFPLAGIGSCNALGTCSDGVRTQRKLDSRGCTPSQQHEQECQICLPACAETTTATITIVCNTTTVNVTQYMFPTASCLQPNVEVTHPHDMASMIAIGWRQQDKTSRSLRHMLIVTDHTDTNELRTYRASDKIFVDLVEWNTTTDQKYMYKILDVAYTSCPPVSFFLQRPGSGLHPTWPRPVWGTVTPAQAMLTAGTILIVLITACVYPSDHLKTRTRTLWLSVALAMWISLCMYGIRELVIIGFLVITCLYIVLQLLYTLFELRCSKQTLKYPTVNERSRFTLLCKLWLAVTLLSILYIFVF